MSIYYDCCPCCEDVLPADHTEAEDMHEEACPHGCNDAFKEPGQ